MKSAPSILLFGLALGAAGPALAGSPIAALVPDDGGAAFEAELPEGRVIARGDGASLVACGAVLMSATDGSRASIGCGEAPGIELSSGAFRLAVGAKGALIRFGGTELRAANARIWAARTGERWLVRFARDGEQGAVEIAVAIEEPASPPADLSLAPDAVHVFDGGLKAEAPADAGSVAVYRDAIARLAPREPAGRALVPRRVESAEDFASSAATSAAGGGEIEIEAIEVEAGCIEVCVD